MLSKQTHSVITGIIMLGTVSGLAGFFSANASEKIISRTHPKDPADALAAARAAYGLFLREKASSQWDMTISSGEMYKLAEMEILWLEHIVHALPEFPKVCSDYREREKAWLEKFKKEMNRPSDYEGGSMESADMALRGTSLMEERIAELRELRSRASSKL